MTPSNLTLEMLRRLDEAERQADRKAAAEQLQPPSVVCPHCGARSFNPNDIGQRYCVACHRFADDLVRRADE